MDHLDPKWLGFVIYLVLTQYAPVLKIPSVKAQGRKEISNPKKRERELYSRLKNKMRERCPYDKSHHLERLE